MAIQHKGYALDVSYKNYLDNYVPRAKGGMRGKRLDFWEKESNLIFNYNYMKQATSVWD